MRKPDSIVIDGRAYNWRVLCELRERQLEAWRAAQGRQLALFELKEDRCPVSDRTASGRYSEPSLLDLLSQSRRRMLP